MSYRDWRNVDPDWTQADLSTSDLLRKVEERRQDTEFMERLVASVERNREVLDRLADS